MDRYSGFSFSQVQKIAQQYLQEGTPTRDELFSTTFKRSKSSFRQPDAEIWEAYPTVQEFPIDAPKIPAAAYATLPPSAKNKWEESDATFKRISQQLIGCMQIFGTVLNQDAARQRELRELRERLHLPNQNDEDEYMFTACCDLLACFRQCYFTLKYKRIAALQQITGKSGLADALVFKAQEYTNLWNAEQAEQISKTTKLSQQLLFDRARRVRFKRNTQRRYSNGHRTFSQRGQTFAQRGQNFGQNRGRDSRHTRPSSNTGPQTRPNRGGRSASRQG
jgi:hypothetical protein